jgi:hypothetical protein
LLISEGGWMNTKKWPGELVGVLARITRIEKNIRGENGLIN